MLLGNGLGFWKTMPMRRRRVTGSVSGVLMSSSSNRISPAMRKPGIRSFIRLKQRRRVLLPQPEGPIRAVIWLRGMAIEMSRRARADPYHTDRSRAERTTGDVAPTAGATSPAGDGDGKGGGVAGTIWVSGRLMAFPGSGFGPWSMI